MLLLHLSIMWRLILLLVRVPRNNNREKLWPTKVGKVALNFSVIFFSFNFIAFAVGKKMVGLVVTENYAEW